nr:integrase, catalytic region, zinc finger, CCHC-type, peptidase aspartic, catalytic [Tanacetum cinerariifolium]
MLVVPACGDGADAVAAGATAANEVPLPPPPPVTPPLDVPPTHTSSSTPGPSTATHDTPVRDPTPVREPTLVREPTPMREPTPVREPTPSPVSEPTTFQEPTPEPPRPSPPSPPPCLTRQPSFLEDISKDGSGYVSLPKSNEALPTTALTAAGGVEDSVALTDLSLKLDRVKRLEGILQQRKRRMVLFDSEGEEAATKEHEINLDALHELASTSLGGDTTVKAAYTIYKASHDAHASTDAGHDEDEVPDTTTMPFRRTRTKRRQLRKTFTSSAFEHFQENIFAVEDTIPTGAGCSKHITGNRALLTDFVEKFLGTVRYGNNDFVVIAGYGDVVIGSMMIKKVYYVEGLGHNLFSVGQFCDKGLEVAFQKSTCFV